MKILNLIELTSADLEEISGGLPGDGDTNQGKKTGWTYNLTISDLLISPGQNGHGHAYGVFSKTSD